MHWAESQVILIEELNPEVIGHKGAPVEEGDELHNGKSAVRAGPERKAHYGWRELLTGREVMIVKALLKVVLPEEESEDEEDTEDEEGDNI